MDADNELMAICDAVAAEINTSGRLAPTMAVRREFPDVDLPDTQHLQVIVSPSYSQKLPAVAEEPEARGLTEITYHVDVGVLKKIENVEHDCPPLREKADDLRELLRNRALTEYPAARWRGTEVLAICDRHTLKTKRTFIAVFTLAYSVHAS